MTKLPKGLSKEQVAEWKAEYGRVYMHRFGLNTVVYRGLRNQEWDQETEEALEKMVNKAVLFSTQEITPLLQNQAFLSFLSSASGFADQLQSFMIDADFIEEENEAAKEKGLEKTGYELFIERLESTREGLGAAIDESIDKYTAILLNIGLIASNEDASVIFAVGLRDAEDYLDVSENDLLKKICAEDVIYPGPVEDVDNLLRGEFQILEDSVMKATGFIPTGGPITL